MNLLEKVLLWWIGVPLIIGFCLKAIGLGSVIDGPIMVIIVFICVFKGVKVIFKEERYGHEERCPHCGTKSSSKYKVCPACGRKK